MLFWFKINWFSPVKLRTGSSVPVIDQRRTNTQTKHNQDQPTLTNTCSRRLAMLTRHGTVNAQEHDTRSDTCRNVHNRLPCCQILTLHQQHGRPLNHPNSTSMRCDSPTRYLASVLPCCPTPLPSTRQRNHPHRNSNNRAHKRTADAVLEQIQLVQPGQVAHWIERACDCLTPHQHTDKAIPSQQTLTNTCSHQATMLTRQEKAKHRHTKRDQTHVVMHTTGCRAAKH
jgi:hypothetical protein